MNIRTYWAWLRNAIERRFSRTRWVRNRIPDPTAAPPAPALPLESTLPSVPAPPAIVGHEVSPAPEPEAPSAPVPIPEIVVPRAPGRFETDAALGMHPKLYDAPHKRREFVIYLPAGWSTGVRAPLIVLCHGCKQTPEEFAKGSRIAALADRLGCLVLMPRQTKWANPWRCWNWFDPSMAKGGGEAEIVAAQVRFVRQRYRADPRRVMAVGISAGAALAAVLGVRYPRQVRAVVTHAGVACGAASSAMAAHDVMLRGPQTDVEAIGTQARAKFGGALAVPLLAIHGENDTVVSPVNSIALVRQYLHLNGHSAVSADIGAPAELPTADSTVTLGTVDGRDVTTREWRIEGRLVVRYVAIAGLGHAWSGGDDALAFNDPRAPDASQLVGDFLVEALR
jgi:poly(hydroxyalkanoate) depolymerase family esterase